MILTKILIPLIISIGIITVDYKFNIFLPIKTAVNFTIIPIHSFINLPFNIYQLLDNSETENQNTTKELLALKVKSQKYNALLLENQKLSNILNASYQIKGTNLNLARITNVKQSRLKKHITIDKGTNNGVNNGQVVLAENGVVGKIILSSISNSIVRLMTDPLQYTPVINSRSGERGIAKGIANNKNQLIINYINPKADIKMGDVFITSGKGGLFNNSYPIGYVSEIIQDNKDFISIILKPSQNINSTIFVIVDSTDETLNNL